MNVVRIIYVIADNVYIWLWGGNARLQQNRIITRGPIVSVPS
jgi:hypothetical protein